MMEGREVQHHSTSFGASKSHGVFAMALGTLLVLFFCKALASERTQLKQYELAPNQSESYVVNRKGGSVLLEFRDKGADFEISTKNSTGLSIVRSWGPGEGRYYLYLDKNFPEEVELTIRRYGKWPGKANVTIKQELYSLNDLSNPSCDLNKVSQAYLALSKTAAKKECNEDENDENDEEECQKSGSDKEKFNLKTISKVIDSIECKNKEALYTKVNEHHDSIKQAFESAISATGSAECEKYHADLSLEYGIYLLEKHEDICEGNVALSYMNKALSLYEAIGDSSFAALTKQYAGRASFSLGSAEDAENYYQEALNYRLQVKEYGHVAQLYNNQGELERFTGRYIDSVDSYKKAIQYGLCNLYDVNDIYAGVINSNELCVSLGSIQTFNVNMAMALEGLGRTNEAESLFASLNNYEDGDVTTGTRAWYKHNRGAMLIKLGKFPEAQELLYDAHNILKEDDSSLSYSNLGLLSKRIGDYESAESYFETAFTLSIKDIRSAAIAMRNLGELYLDKALVNDQDLQEEKTLADAQTLLDGALLLASRLNDQRLLLSIKGLIGKALDAQGKGQEAINVLTEAMLQAEQLNIVKVRRKLGARLVEVFLANGDTERAERIIDRVALLDPDYENKVEKAELYMKLSKAYWAQGKRDADAEALVQMAYRLVEGQRLEFVGPSNRIDYLKKSHDVYSYYIDFLMNRASSSHERIDKKNVVKAWEVAERTHSRVLLDMIRSKPGANSHSQSKKQQHLRLIQSLDDQLIKIDGGDVVLQDGDTLRAELKYKRDKAQAEYLNLLTSNDLKQTGLVEFQEVLKDNERVLSYFLADGGSHLWVIGPDSVDYQYLDAKLEIEKSAKEFIDNIVMGRSSSSMQGEGRELKKKLLPNYHEALKNVSKLIVIPDAALNYVPFSLVFYDELPDIKEGISVVNSASMLTELRRAVLENNNEIAVLGNPTFKNASQLLRGTEKEVQRIESFSQYLPVTAWTQDEVSKDVFTSDTLNSFKIIHIATHGVADEKRPELSRLLMSNSELVKNADLYPDEIKTLALNADLVILSGCETGIGKSLTGEGLLSLSRSFFVAGAKNVIASLWEISDEATAVFMEQFYTNYVINGYSVSRSFRKAQLWMQSENEWAKPFYWAGFVLQGG